MYLANNTNLIANDTLSLAEINRLVGRGRKLRSAYVAHLWRLLRNRIFVRPRHIPAHGAAATR